jgi:diguanylate cyclase (GGDEF)-like protein
MIRRRPRRAWLLAAVILFVPALSAQAADARVAEIERSLRGQPERALQALAPLIPATQGADRVEALMLRGLMLNRLPDAEATEQTAQELDRLAANGDSPLAAAAAGLLRARLLARDGPLERADRLMTESVARLPADAPATMRMSFIEAQARIRQLLGKLEDAVRLHQQAVTLGDGVAPDWHRAEQRSSLAYALFQAQQVERALAVNQDAVALARKAQDPLALSATMTTDGIVLGALGRTVEELNSLRAAIDYARQASARRDEVLAIANLADYYLTHGDPATALSLSREALPLTREVRDHSSESVALANAGLALIALGRHREGTPLVRQALLIEERAGALTSMAEIQREFGVALERAGQLGPAWKALVEHRRLADELFQRQHQQTVLELQESFEADRRQLALSKLQTENALKEAQLLGRDLQQRLWAVSLTAGVLLLAVLAVPLRRMRRSNAALKNTNALLEVAGGHDPLTGLANRRHFQAVMEREGAGAFEGSLLLLDVDHFKRINDVYGHVAGDAVLVELAARLRRALRLEDLTVRWGGEEFLIVVRALPPEQVEALAQRLLATVGNEPVRHGQETIAVTASIGFATFPLRPARLPQPWASAIDLVDTAMYLAKAHGRNRAYGVRSLAAEEGAAAGRQAGALESAWRAGRAELMHLPGPVPLEPVA